MNQSNTDQAQPSSSQQPMQLLAPLAPVALDATEAAAYLRISDSLLEKLVRQGEFPQPRQLSGRRVVYLVAELNEWLFSRPVSTIAPPPKTDGRKAQRAA